MAKASPKEVVIGDHNWTEHVVWQGPDGQHRARGLVPRDYTKYPRGYLDCCRAVDVPVIPRAEWSERIKDKVAKKSQISDLRMVGNGGQPIPALDQNGKGYCWAHSSTSAVMMLRCVMNQPYVGLSAYAIACIIKHYRDEGGWGAQSLDFITQRGVPSEKFWPMQSMSSSNDNPNTWANAAQHKVTEGWIDLQAAQYDRNMSFEQEISLYLVNNPAVKDENWWSHSICGIDAVDGESQRQFYRNDSGKLPSLKEFDLVWGMNDPVTGGIGVRILNSWGNSWSQLGTGILTGSKAVSDGCVAPRITNPSPA